MAEAITPKQKLIAQTLIEFPQSSYEEISARIKISSTYIAKIAAKLNLTRTQNGSNPIQQELLYSAPFVVEELNPDNTTHTALKATDNKDHVSNQSVDHKGVTFHQVPNSDARKSKPDEDGRPLHPITRRTGTSVSNIVGQLDKPALMYWAANMAAEEAIRRPYNPNKENIKSATYRISRAFRKTRKQSQQRGSRIHQYIEEETPLNQVAEEFRGYVAAAKQAMSDLHITPVLQEVTIYGAGYLGTADMFCLVQKDQATAILEWKTTTKDKPQIWPENLMQIAAYANAEVIAAHQIGIAYMPPIQRGVAISLGSKGKYAASVFPVNAAGDAYQQFISLLHVRLRSTNLADLITQQTYAGQADP